MVVAALFHGRPLRALSTRPRPGLQFETRLPWIPDWGVYYQVGLDGYNVLLVLLTAFLGRWWSPGAFSAIRKDVKLFYRDGVLHPVRDARDVLAQDLFLFYVFWRRC